MPIKYDIVALKDIKGSKRGRKSKVEEALLSELVESINMLGKGDNEGLTLELEPDEDIDNIKMHLRKAAKQIGVKIIIDDKIEGLITVYRK
mgnify:CR=1 FL=1